MPIYPLRRAITANTAAGPIKLKYATFINIRNKDRYEAVYWMRTLFYLVDYIKVNILIDRKTMRLLGFDVYQSVLNEKVITHQAAPTNVLTEKDAEFWIN